VAQLTLPETVLIAMSAALGQCLWNYLRRPLPVQVAFSVAALMISAAVTFACQAKLAVLLGIPSLAALVFCSSAIYFLVNTALIAGALAATEFRPPLRIWKQLYLWTLPHYIVGAVVGGTLADASARASWFLVLAAMPAAYYINHNRLVNAVSSEVRHRL
ncbi:MAG TPA: hypothetical protein VHB50_16025, partial [Bryobacteraceae bacterium]|nr:hypothetical protein [Bryobacteraceae bacterium]